MRRGYAEICFDTLLSAIVHGLLHYVVSAAAGEKYLMMASLIWFLLVTVIVQFRKQNGYGNAILVFGLAQSVYSMFSFIAYNAVRFFGLWGILFYLSGILLFFLLICFTRRGFPEENWREYYEDETCMSGKFPVRLWNVYLVVLIGCVILSSFIWCGSDWGKSAFIVAAMGIFALFWCEIGLLIFIQAYKRECNEVLLDKQHCEEMQSFMNVIRSQRHDYNFHVHTIAGLLREGNLEECLKYMDALERDSAVMNSVLPVKDPAISAMLHNFYFLASREGIKLHVDIKDDLAQIATNAYETNKIISNLLQNAIDETKTHEDKTYGIHLDILKRGEYIVIRVSNEVDSHRMDISSMEKIYHQGYSTKQGHEGVGLGSIRQLAGRYHGTVYTRMEGNVVHFVAKIPINFAKKQEG